MTANENHVLMLLAMIAEQSGETVSETRLDFVGRKLLELGPPAQICHALERLMESCRRFPTVAEVKEQIGIADPSARDAALMLADRVLAGVSKYGELQPGNLKGCRAIEKALGPAAWELVTRQGGWNAVVDRAVQAASLRAQLRDAAESYLKCGVIKRESVQGDKLPSYHQALVQADDAPLLGASVLRLPDPNREEPPF
jgi:hypothetical protein